MRILGSENSAAPLPFVQVNLPSKVRICMGRASMLPDSYFVNQTFRSQGCTAACVFLASSTPQLWVDPMSFLSDPIQFVFLVCLLVRRALYNGPDGMPCVALWRPEALDCRELIPPEAGNGFARNPCLARIEPRTSASESRHPSD